MKRVVMILVIIAALTPASNLMAQWKMCVHANGTSTEFDVADITAIDFYPDLSIGLVAYYPFNENANDESGNGNNGVVYGATPTPDRFGSPNKAYLFDGDDDWVFVEDSPDFHFTDKFSISFWVMLETEAPYYYPYKILEKYPSWQVMQREWDIIMGFTDQSGAGNDVPWDTPGVSNLSPGIWYNFTMTFDGTIPDNNFKAFVNGDLIYAADCPGKTVFQSDSNVVFSYHEPNPNAHGIGYYFDGAIDDIRFYNRALADHEIRYIYNPY